ncbi:hypothetical protein [Aquariibacter albus]|uniref:Uncharacterized protein n=1 Tax=Aquariibacter albus TaxID=2759899 RepID=A0A839HTN6_9BURK|nr:hypothetical protein [Aquariibacter albus]MBB1162839.1 hypothetical protein [Aquariibacter albus]
MSTQGITRAIQELNHHEIEQVAGGLDLGSLLVPLAGITGLLGSVFGTIRGVLAPLVAPVLSTLNGVLATLLGGLKLG